MDASYVSPPPSSRGKATSSESERRGSHHKRTSSISDLSKRAAIERPYLGGDGADEDDEEEDVAFRKDLSGLAPIAPENFIRPIPLARRGSRSEKPNPAFFEPEVRAASPVIAARTLERIPEVVVPAQQTQAQAPQPQTPSKRKRKSRGSISSAPTAAPSAVTRTSAAKKWSISEFIGVFVLAIFVAAITVTLQHSW
eukprot:Phypoly_transcript_16269.p1 GENE.Phypoly_transcript_16269~~Phypoly_transcript_16269.p1  ORF type:complete len:229 (-),score=62.71 Phypoly_transcript_16269:188-778(-)